LKIALITIGQSPRIDLYNDLRDYLEKMNYIEIGVLDDYSIDEILKKLRPKPGEDFYVTRLKNGSWVKVSIDKITSELQRKIFEVEEQVDLIVLLCTGKLNVVSKKPLLSLDELLISIVSILKPKKLGVLIPEIKQYDLAYSKWSNVAEGSIVIVNYNPYGEKENILIDRLKDLKEADLVVLDCIGYTRRHAEIIKKYLDKPVVLPRTLVFSIVNDLISG